MNRPHVRSSFFAGLGVASALLCATAPSAHAETTGVETDGWGDPTVWISSPADGELVGSAPASIDVQVFTDDFAERLELHVDGVLLEQGCDSAESCLFSIVLETEGTHTLVAQVIDQGVVADTSEISVEVGPAKGGGASEGGGEGDDDDGSKKGCSVHGGPSGTGMAGALLLLAVGGLGRRRRR